MNPNDNLDAAKVIAALRGQIADLSLSLAMMTARAEELAEQLAKVPAE